MKINTLLDAYTSRLGSSNVELPDPNVTILENKKIPGSETAGVTTLPLGFMLSEEFTDDHHFAMYSHPSETRLTKPGKPGVKHQGIRFEVACLDLDFDNHQSLPTSMDFVNVVRVAHILQFDDVGSPNVVYETKRGARFLWLIEPMEDEDAFEAHFQALVNRVAGLLANTASKYAVDVNAKDWTRLFRCPLVKRDGVYDYNRHVRVFHSNRLNLVTLKVKPRPKPPTYSGDEVYKGDRRFVNRLVEIREGNRNLATFKAAAYVLQRYRPIDAEKLITVISTKAAEAGLEHVEIERTIESARRRVGLSNKH